LSFVGFRVVDVDVEDVEVELTVVGTELGGVTVGVLLEQAAARSASPVTMMCHAFIGPPRSPT